MANIYDYIDWRGDLTIDQDPFNEVDNLILSRLSYFPFEGLILNNEEKITIREASKRSENMPCSNENILQIEDIELLSLLGKSNRFGMMFVANYVNKISSEEQKQFSAITVLMSNNMLFISYRGTDNTLVGWKEDFNMSFMKNIPSQKDAVSYLEEIADFFTGDIWLGGRSKGGNLAVYAAAFCKDELKDRIKGVFNNDGPGFEMEIIKDKRYREILNKVHIYVPQSSVVGRLLNHEGSYTIVKSVQVGLLQHDIYSWQVIGNQCVYVDKITNGSEFIDKTLKNWLERLSTDERKQFVQIIFEILDATHATTLSELSTKWFKNARILLKSYRGIDEESKKIISATLFGLVIATKNNFFSNTPKLPLKKK